MIIPSSFTSILFRLVGALVLSLSVPLPVPAGDWDAVVHQADAYFKSGQYSDALKLYQQVAEETANRYAQFQMGWIYNNGLGVPIDYREAARWYTLAATQGEATAANNLSILYAGGGHGLAAEPRSAMFYLKRSADAGDARGQANLAWHLAQGDGVEKNPYEAYALASKSATQGDSLGRLNLARFLVDGIGVPADARKALQLIRQGAEDESDRNVQQQAQFSYGEMLDKGVGAAPDGGSAYQWYLIAGTGPDAQFAKVASENATRIEAMLPAEVVAEAQRRANAWLQSQNSTAMSPDQLFAGAMSAVQKEDFATAAAMVRPLADQKDPRGLWLLGLFQEEGRGGFKQDENAAFVSFDSACHKNYWPACLSEVLMLARQNKQEQARTIVVKMEDIVPEDLASKMTQARLLAAQGYFDRAETLTRIILSQDSINKEALEVLDKIKELKQQNQLEEQAQREQRQGVLRRMINRG